MSRRPVAISLLGLVASLSVVLGACNATPAAPALTDPKDILTKAAVSVKDVHTFEVVGTMTGSIKAAQLGDFDLSSVKLSGDFDIPNKKAKLSLDAPTLLGTKVDALLIDQTAYVKATGAAALAFQASGDKWTKVPVTPTASGGTSDVTDVTDVTKLTADLQSSLDKLPSPPVKQPNEKCGDQDCYHVTITMTADQIRALDPTSSVSGDVTFDVWTRTSDYRPAKAVIGVTTVDLGTFAVTLNLTYDVAVSVDTPPADQIANP